MAKTGRTDIGLSPHPHTYILNVPQPEKASQTFASGAVLQLSAGFLIGSGTGTLSTGYGIAIDAGQDFAEDGDGKASNFRFEQGQMYEGTLNGVLAATDIGTTAKLAQAAGGIPTFTVETGGTQKWRIVGPAPGWEVGDTNARIYAIPFDSFIEQGGGNE